MCSKSQPFKAALVILRLKLRFVTLLLNEKCKIVLMLHSIISSAVLTPWGLAGNRVRSVLLSLHSLEGQWFLAHWESWRYRSKDEAEVFRSRKAENSLFNYN